MSDIRLAAEVVAEVKKAVVGKDDILVKALLAVLARGHILLEDIPGVGKTTMALAFSRALGLAYHRVQFTPDVMPSDITGFSLSIQRMKNTKKSRGARLKSVLKKSLSFWYTLPLRIVFAFSFTL